MSKELEAFNFISDKLNGFEHYEQVEINKHLECILKTLTPPTADEVCKALSEQLKTLIKTGKNKHGVTFNYVNTGKKLISLNYDLINIAVQLPPHLIELVARFYKGESK